MGLASALNTALTGLNASETTIDVVGNNLANSNTVGFKSSEASFATQFLQTQSLGSAPTSASGGVNPRQLGLGTMVADITPNFNQGTIQISSSPTDMAIQGDGFFIVRGNAGEYLYTRNGLFKMNASNELVTLTGNRLLGYGVDANFQIDQSGGLVPLKIPLGSAAVAQATRNVYLQGTLSPTGTVASQGQIIQTDMLSDGAFARPQIDPLLTKAAGSLPPKYNGAVDTSGGTLAEGNYSYRLVYVDPVTGTESMYSQYSASVPVGGGTVKLTAMDYTDGVERRLYRADVGADPDKYQLLKTFGPGEYTLDAWDDDGTATPDPDPARDMNTDTIQGDYTYYVTFVDAQGNESLPSYPIKADRLTNPGRIQLQGIPTDTSGDWTGGRRIYRNLSSAEGAETFYLVGEISDYSSTDITFTDCRPDASIVPNPLIPDPTKKALDFYGPRVNDSTTLAVNVLRRNGTEYTSVFQEGTFIFTPQKGGRALQTKEMEITSTTLLRDVINFMADAMGIQTPPGPDPENPIKTDASGYNPGPGVTASGQIRFISNSGLDNAVEIDLSGLAMKTTAGVIPINLQFNTLQEPNGESVEVDFIVYDSLGESLPVRLTAVLEDRDSNATTFRWYADSPSNISTTDNDHIAVGTGLIRFDGKGNFVSATNSQIQIYRDGESAAQSPLAFKLDFSTLSGLATSSSSLAVSRQDGSAPGVLTSFIVGGDGLIRGVFSNGVTRNLGQIRLARFSNPAGLEQKGQNLFAGGVNSGEPVTGNPGMQGIGEIIAGAMELSNTDIGANLIDLILASTMYRGNSRVITTVQQMLDELLNLRR